LPLSLAKALLKVVEVLKVVTPLSLPSNPHARPFEPYPVPVLGAVCPFLEPFRGHSSPKVVKTFQN
jgi:hypothetical protein